VKYLLDTDICSLAIKGDQNVLRKMAETKGDWCISAVSLQELAVWLLGGKGSRYEVAVEKFIRSAEVLDFTASDALAAADLYVVNRNNGHNIGVVDNQLAGQAANCDLTLVTNNLKHFRPIPGLSSESWV